MVLGLKSDEPSQETGETTLPVQQTLPTENPEAEAFADGMFTFTVSQFRERFEGTLPEGYQFSDEAKNNESRSNNLQMDILNASGENTGFAVLFNIKDSGQSFNQLALTADWNGDGEAFSVLTNWLVTTLLSGSSQEEQGKYCEAYRQLFDSKSEDYKLFTTETYVTMMMLEEEEMGKQYYVLVSIN